MNLFFQFIFSILSYIIPKKKNLIVCGSGDGNTFNGNPKFFYLFILKKSDKDAYWSTNNKRIYKMLKEKGYPVILKKTFKGLFVLLRAKFMVIEKSSLDVSYIKSIIGRFNYIQSNHGTPLKKVGDDAITIIKNKTIDRLMKKFKIYSKLKYKYFISASDEVDKIVLSAFGNKNIITSGYPRNDVFYNKDLLFFDYSKSMTLNKYNKVFLYAPTFRDNNIAKPFSEKLKFTDIFFKENNYILLIKKHPCDRALNISENYSNIVDISSQVDDIQELLPFIDVMITDYSSTFFDYILTENPVIFYSYDLDEYLRSCRGMYYDYYKELPGPFAKTEDELFELIKTVDEWSYKKSYIEKYKTFTDKFNKFKDGNSSKRLLEIIYK